MSPAEVRAAASKLFGAGIGAALSPTTVEPGFTAIYADDVVAPEIGPARVIFVFRDNRLRAVNLEQIVEKPSDAQRRALIDRAAYVTAGLKGRPWPLFNVDIGNPFGPNNLLVFSGRDDFGNGVQVSLVGINYAYTGEDGVIHRSPHAKGPAALCILIEQGMQDRSYIKSGDFASNANAAEILGFRSAAFGMSQGEVRKAIAKDFGITGGAVQSLVNRKQHTKILAVGLPRVDPGPCPAAISYIFDDARGKLVAINVEWAYPGNANIYQRAAIMIAAQRLSHYFAALPKQPVHRQPVGALGPQTVLLYAARDCRGNRVTVEADGVNIHLKNASATQKAATGPAILRIAYDVSGENN